MKKVAAIAVAVSLAWVFAGPVSANPKFAKDTGKPCATCHITTGKPDLNDVGKCFKEKKDLAACAKK
jgi:hypothetical protein